MGYGDVMQEENLDPSSCLAETSEIFYFNLFNACAYRSKVLLGTSLQECYYEDSFTVPEC